MEIGGEKLSQLVEAIRREGRGVPKGGKKPPLTEGEGANTWSQKKRRQYPFKEM